MIETLRGRRIAGAALDVFKKEPLRADSELLTLDNVILKSHSIGWTEELFRDMGRINCEGAVEIMQGKPPAGVDAGGGISCADDPARVIVAAAGRLGACDTGHPRSLARDAFNYAAAAPG